MQFITGLVNRNVNNMQLSEEVNQINSALIHCTQLKTQLQGTLLHIQNLNSKYNQIDYMAVIHNLENYRTKSGLKSSPYPKMYLRDQTIRRKCGNDRNFQSSTPVRRSVLIRRIKVYSSMPKQSNIFSLMDDSLDSCQSDFDTPKRSVREMKKNSNTISVRTIKVQRNIEAIITQLQVLQRSQKKHQRQQMEQSLYQSCCNSSIASPGQLGHSCCKDSSTFATAFCSNDSPYKHNAYQTPNKNNRYDESQKTLERVERFYATPLQRMHKRLTHLNASLVSTC